MLAVPARFLPACICMCILWCASPRAAPLSVSLYIKRKKDWSPDSEHLDRLSRTGGSTGCTRHRRRLCRRLAPARRRSCRHDSCLHAAAACRSHRARRSCAARRRHASHRRRRSCRRRRGPAPRAAPTRRRCRPARTGGTARPTSTPPPPRAPPPSCASVRRASALARAPTHAVTRPPPRRLWPARERAAQLRLVGRVRASSRVPHAPCAVSPRLPRRRKVPRAGPQDTSHGPVHSSVRTLYDSVRAACAPLPPRRTRRAAPKRGNPAGRTWAPHARPARSFAAATAYTISPACAHPRAPRACTPSASTCR